MLELTYGLACRNTFDLADQYSNGRCEELVGKAIKKLELPRENLVLMTKVCTVFKGAASLPSMNGRSADLILSWPARSSS